MSSLDIVVAVLVGPGALISLYGLAATLWMTRALRLLAAMPKGDTRPSISIISPACNEAPSIGSSVESWLLQADVDAQIVVVDDRSTDDTAAIIDDLAARHREVSAIHVHQLPEGWLGKLNALHQGVQHATGDWLLFADADVHLADGALARSIHYAEARGFDLVSAYPQIESAGFLGDIAWAAMGAAAGPSGFWRSRDPKSTRAFAMGAFILVRREAFEKTPGFPWLKLEVADDMGLAILLKHHGHRCDVLCGRGQVRLRWYTSFGNMVRRSQKNWFGIACRFSLARALVFALTCVAFAATPLTWLLPIQSTAVAALPIVSVGSFIATSVVEAAWSGRARLPALFAPLGLLLVAAMVLRAGLLGRRLGGIEWRGVVYPSEMLRDAQRFQM